MFVSQKSDIINAVKNFENSSTFKKIDNDVGDNMRKTIVNIYNDEL